MSKSIETNKIKYRLQYLFLQEAYERQRDEIMQSFGFEYDNSKKGNPELSKFYKLHRPK